MLVTRVGWNGTEYSTTRRPDHLIVEEPMSIQLDGALVSTTMRTPGHDFELAVGFCLTEGLLAGAPVVGVRYCAAAHQREIHVVFADRIRVVVGHLDLLGLATVSDRCPGKVTETPPTQSRPRRHDLAGHGDSVCQRV